ncbi:MAG: hypothetical protein ACI8ZM_002821 [Crocinitomix sp.]|jgi:hypothetical protein
MFKKGHFRFWIKLIFALAILTYLWWKISDSLGEGLAFSQFEFSNIGVLLTTVLLLMLANWSIEALKWKRLMNELQPLSFRNALKGVLAGVSTGLITPNRVGNFIGRVVVLEKEHRTKATLLTLLSNLAQFVPSIFFGCLGLLFINADFFNDSRIILFTGSLVLIVLAMSLYLNPQLVNRKPFNHWFSDKIIDAIAFVQSTSIYLKLYVIGLSSARYWVFVTQYVLILLLFNQPHHLVHLFAGVSVVYLLMTIIPGFFFGKLFVREAAGLLVLGEMGIPNHVIIVTGFMLWLINIALPSLVGAIILLRKK